jgi:tRNA1Val (adenine37-N6)-methyltransferase
MAFRFKQFSVEDHQSSMRVGSDAVLLGAWADVKNDSRILEIGTGCGVISILLAQRSNASIDALDVDQPSIMQAQQNFGNSKWNERLYAIPISLQEFTATSMKKYDHILTNPPYFRDSLKSPDILKNIAKHENLLSYEDLLHCVSQLLDKTGKLSLILPEKESKIFTTLAGSLDLFQTRILRIKPKTSKPVNRVLMEFSFLPPVSLFSEELCIRNEDNSYSSGYIKFTEPYYLSLK